MCIDRLSPLGIADWYFAETKNYDVFAQKYPMNLELIKQGDNAGCVGETCPSGQVPQCDATGHFVGCVPEGMHI